MGDDDYDDFSKELNHYKKSKDRGRGEFSDLLSGILQSVITGVTKELVL